MRPLARWCVALAAGAALLGAALLPPNPSMTLTDGSLALVDGRGRLISTAVLCPGLTFDGLGRSGPTLSPDQHWVLVDVLGPYLPGDVARRHALVQVRTGRFVTSADFRRYLGVAPASTGILAWRSGERATLVYPDGSSGRVPDPPLRPLPAPTCAPPTPR